MKKTLYRMYYNDGVGCWLGADNLTLKQCGEYLKSNLKRGNTVTFEKMS